MLIFGIDTCCAAATAAICSEKALVAQTVINLDKTHSQIMMPQIEEMFKITKIDPSEIDAFAAAVGPGSFTGVRIGVATAKGLAQGLNKPCIAVSTLRALAHCAQNFKGIACPILDARRSQVYNALFRCDGSGISRISPDRALALSELLAELSELDEDILFMGDGVRVFRDEITETLGSRAKFTPLITRMNLAGSVAEIGLEKFKDGEVIHYSEMIPSYVRLSQAEQDKLNEKK